MDLHTTSASANTKTPPEVELNLGVKKKRLTPGQLRKRLGIEEPPEKEPEPQKYRAVW